MACPSNQTNNVGDTVSFKVEVLGNEYKAGGLPAGLSIDSATGLITGSPTTVEVAETTVDIRTFARGLSGGTGTTSSNFTNPSKKDGEAPGCLQIEKVLHCNETEINPGIGLGIGGPLQVTIKAWGSVHQPSFSVEEEEPDPGPIKFWLFIDGIEYFKGEWHPGEAGGWGQYKIDGSSFTVEPGENKEFELPGRGAGFETTLTEGFHKIQILFTGAESELARFHGMAITTSEGEPETTKECPFAWTIQEESPPVLTCPGTQTNHPGESVTLAVESTFTTEYKAVGLPAGLTINAGTGVITGTATHIETVIVKLTVKGLSGEASCEFEWAIIPSEPEEGIGDQWTYKGDPVSLRIRIPGGKVYKATGLPEGLTMSGDGLVTGTPTTLETTSVEVTVE